MRAIVSYNFIYSSIKEKQKENLMKDPTTEMKKHTRNPSYTWNDARHENEYTKYEHEFRKKMHTPYVRYGGTRYT